MERPSDHGTESGRRLREHVVDALPLVVCLLALGLFLAFWGSR